MEKTNLKIRWVISAFLFVLVFGSLPAQAAQTGSIVSWGDQPVGADLSNGFIAIAGGSYYSLGLRDDGYIAAWGRNDRDQCNVPSPNSGFVAISANYSHSLGLKDDGSVTGWGYNHYGQCNIPAPNSGFINIAVGMFHSLGLKEDGSVVGWGYDYYGQCDIPVPNSGFIDIKMGNIHDLGLKEDGSVVGWGSNDFGQCNVPAPNSGFIAISAGGVHSLGLKDDGSIVAWGDNRYNQCNIPTPNNGFVAISAGHLHSLGLKEDGSVTAWGYNDYGQCNVPVPNSGYIGIAAGRYHSLALVGEVGTGPVADAGAEQTVMDTDDNGSEDVTLDGSGSSDLDGVIISWEWTDNLGDTIPDGEITTAALSIGTHTITLTVTDDDSLTDTDTVTVTVDPVPEPVPVEMVAIPGGEFEMGDVDGYSDELPVHAVLLDSFFMSKYEITNQQYCDYLNSALGSGSIYLDSDVVKGTGNNQVYCETTTNSSYSRITWNGSSFGVVSDKEDHPMVEVSWYGSVAYCNWRSSEGGYEACYNLSTWVCDFTKKGYRLATEAEWEYAARGGNHSPYYRYPWGDSIDGSKANYWDSGDPYETGDYPYATPVGYYDGSQIPAGSDMANGYGLYDMAGNVYEWCNDWFGSTYYSTTPYPHINPTGPTSTTSIYCRVLRGGCWNFNALNCRVAERTLGTPGARDGIFGFRIVRDSEPATVIYVKQGGTGSGTSWADAYGDLQDALDDAGSGDEIWVKAGTYAISAEIQVNKPIGIYGGFAGSEIERIQRDWANNTTTIDGQGITRIFRITDEPTIDGFTLTNGYYTGALGGGAIFIGGVSSWLKTVRISNCIISGNTAYANPIGPEGFRGGGAIHIGIGDPLFMNCLIINNSTNAYGGGVNVYSGSPQFINCTISKNTALMGGGVYMQGRDTVIDAQFYNCIISGNTGTIDANDLKVIANGDPPQGSNNCSSVQIGTGTILADPLFIDPDSDDFHLQVGSPCIDTGDNSVVDPNATDLDGNPRIVNGTVDMGAYEFFYANSPPVADAGDDQIVYICADGAAQIELDGSGSTDADGDELEYLWTWEIGGTLFDANGVSPIIELPAGLHTINLTVDDGVEVSEPNWCVIEVIEGIEVDLRVMPRVINRKSGMRRILAVVQLPADIDGDNIDGSFWLYPGEIEPHFSCLMTVNGSQKLFMVFDKSELMAAAGANGAVVLEIEGQLTSGQCLYGSDRIRIIRRGRGPREQTGLRKGKRFRRNRVKKSR